MSPARFEPAIPADDWPHTLALDRSVTGIGVGLLTLDKIFVWLLRLSKQYLTLWSYCVGGNVVYTAQIISN